MCSVYESETIFPVCASAYLCVNLSVSQSFCLCVCMLSTSSKIAVSVREDSKSLLVKSFIPSTIRYLNSVAMLRRSQVSGRCRCMCVRVCVGE